MIRQEFVESSCANHLYFCRASIDVCMIVLGGVPIGHFDVAKSLDHLRGSFAEIYQLAVLQCVPTREGESVISPFTAVCDKLSAKMIGVLPSDVVPCLVKETDTIGRLDSIFDAQNHLSKRALVLAERLLEVLDQRFWCGLGQGLLDCFKKEIGLYRQACISLLAANPSPLVLDQDCIRQHLLCLRNFGFAQVDSLLKSFAERESRGAILPILKEITASLSQGSDTLLPIAADHFYRYARVCLL